MKFAVRDWCWLLFQHNFLKKKWTNIEWRNLYYCNCNEWLWPKKKHFFNDCVYWRGDEKKFSFKQHSILPWERERAVRRRFNSFNLSIYQQIDHNILPFLHFFTSSFIYSASCTYIEHFSRKMVKNVKEKEKKRQKSGSLHANIIAAQIQPGLVSMFTLCFSILNIFLLAQIFWCSVRVYWFMK